MLLTLCSEPDWKTKMKTEYDCPSCKAHLLHHQLKLHSKVVEICPICETVISENHAFHMSHSSGKQNSDVSLIDAWLDQECTASGSACRKYHDPVVADLYHWTVSGELLKYSQPNWLLELNYSADSPGIFSIKGIAVEQNAINTDRFDKIEKTITALGLQPHGSASRPGSSRSSSWKAGGNKTNMTRWGVKQYFTTAHLAPGLLPAVVRRLFKVMEKVMLTI